MLNPQEGPSESGATKSELENEELESLAARLRELIRRSRAAGREGGRLRPEDLSVLASAAQAIERIPDALRQGMQNAFELGREHGRKEELLTRLEREIAEESARVGREAWGEDAPVRKPPDS